MVIAPLLAFIANPSPILPEVMLKVTGLPESGSFAEILPTNVPLSWCSNVLIV